MRTRDKGDPRIPLKQLLVGQGAFLIEQVCQRASIMAMTLGRSSASRTSRWRTATGVACPWQESWRSRNCVMSAVPLSGHLLGPPDSCRDRPACAVRIDLCVRPEIYPSHGHDARALAEPLDQEAPCPTRQPVFSGMRGSPLSACGMAAPSCKRVPARGGSAVFRVGWPKVARVATSRAGGQDRLDLGHDGVSSRMAAEKAPRS